MVTSNSRLKVHLASGGGFALKLQLMPTPAKKIAIRNNKRMENRRTPHCRKERNTFLLSEVS